MECAFEIAGHRCEANAMRMYGRTLEANFAADAAGPLSDAFANNLVVSFLGAAMTSAAYAIEAIETDVVQGCKAVFSQQPH